MYRAQIEYCDATFVYKEETFEKLLKAIHFWEEGEVALLKEDEEVNIRITKED